MKYFIMRSARCFFTYSALLVLFALSTIGAGTARAADNSADDYIHGGSAKYIQGRIQEASVEVDEGLAKYPRDIRLKAMADQLKKLKDQKKKDQGGSSSQNSDDQKNNQDKKDSSGQGSQQNKNQDQKDKDKKDQDKKKDSQKGQDEKKDQEKDKDKGQQDQQDKAKDDRNKGDSSGQAAAPAKPGQMSKDEAERLLNSYQDDEKREHEQMQHRQRKPVEVEKDW